MLIEQNITHTHCWHSVATLLRFVFIILEKSIVSRTDGRYVCTVYALQGNICFGTIAGDLSCCILNPHVVFFPQMQIKGHWVLLLSKLLWCWSLAPAFITASLVLPLLASLLEKMKAQNRGCWIKKKKITYFLQNAEHGIHWCMKMPKSAYPKYNDCSF